MAGAGAVSGLAAVWDGRGRRRFHLGAVGGAGGDVGVVVGVVHQPGSGSLSDSGGRKAAGADQARRLTSSTEADWGGRSHGGPGHGVALPAAGGGWALSGERREALTRALCVLRGNN